MKITIELNAEELQEAVCEWAKKHSPGEGAWFGYTFRAFLPSTWFNDMDKGTGASVVVGPPPAEDSEADYHSPTEPWGPDR